MSEKIETQEHHKEEVDEAPPPQPVPSSEAGPASWKERVSRLFTRQVLQILLLGQVLSLCITATTLFSTKLAQGDDQGNVGVSIPTSQSFLNYFVLGVVYTGITLYKEGFRGWLTILRRRSLYCKCLVWNLVIDYI